MAFWSNKDTSPARKYRFKVGTAKNINWWYANSVSLPSFEINTNEYQLINQKFKYPGVPTWNDVTISIVDVADSVKEIKKLLKQYKFDFLQVEGIQKVYTRTLNQFKADKFKPSPIDTARSPYVNDTSEEALTRDLSQAQKEFNNQGNDFVIEQMKSDGKTLRTWTLVNSFIKSVNYGDLDYGSDELVSIEIVVSYDYATTEK